MAHLKYAFLLLFSLSLLTEASEVSPASVGVIECLDPALDRLVAPEAQIEKVAEGFRWAEGPVWIDGSVIFSDVLANLAYRWKPGIAMPEVFLNPSGLLSPASGFIAPGSNGLARDAEGRLLLCQQGERRVALYENGGFRVLADRFEGMRFNSPNDLVVRRNGEIYFTDPPYGLEGRDHSALREIPFDGIYRIATNRTVTLLTKVIKWCNGIAFSPDEKTLYIGVTEPAFPHILACDVAADHGFSFAAL